MLWNQRTFVSQEYTHTHTQTHSKGTNGTVLSMVVMKLTDVTAGGKTWIEYYGLFADVMWQGEHHLILCLFTVFFLQTYLLGIIISICGNVLISISLNIQVGSVGIQLYSRRPAHSRLPAPVKTNFSTLCSVMWVACFLTGCSLFSRLCMISSIIKKVLKDYISDLVTARD